MARIPTVPSPLDSLEDAFDLLQQAPLSAWLRYLTGAGPLVIGVLFVWNQFSAPGFSENGRGNPLIAALLLVALLVWFYRCRQSFAGRLRGLLSLTPSAGKARGSWSLACFEGSRLLFTPIAIFSIVPMAFATAFYRSLSLYAGQGLPAREAAVKAWRTAGAWQRQNWFAMAIFSLLALAVFVNVVLTVILAPMLVKVFTGYESILSRRGAATISIVFPVILVLTWLCLDPLLQSLYVVRAFKLDGLSTGEDLLMRLRRLAPAVMVLAATIAMNVRAAEPALSRDSLNRSIDQTLTAKDYDWRLPPPPPDAEKKDWFVDAVDGVMKWVKKGWTAVTDFWSDLLDWLDRLISDKSHYVERAQTGKPPGVRALFYAIAGLVLALAVVLLWKYLPGSKKPLPVAASASSVDLRDERILASDLPEDEWLRMAEQYIGAGDLRLALRALFLATLAILSQRGFLTIHACKSNRDYAGELRRRSRDEDLARIFGRNTRWFEQSWYGFHEVTDEQIQNFRENLGRMRAHAA